jgi:hypothetical protein
MMSKEYLKSFMFCESNAVLGGAVPGLLGAVENAKNKSRVAFLFGTATFCLVRSFV